MPVIRTCWPLVSDLRAVFTELRHGSSLLPYFIVEIHLKWEQKCVSGSPREVEFGRSALFDGTQGMWVEAVKGSS